MATLWDIITGNSTLPVQAGNTFWDHLNAQAGGGGSVTFINGMEVQVQNPEINVAIENNNVMVKLDPAISVVVEEVAIGVTVENEIQVAVDNEINIKIGCD